MSIRNKLHQQKVEEGDFLSQYDSISTDNKIIEALEIDLRMHRESYWVLACNQKDTHKILGGSNHG